MKLGYRFSTREVVAPATIPVRSTRLAENMAKPGDFAERADEVVGQLQWLVADPSTLTR